MFDPSTLEVRHPSPGVADFVFGDCGDEIAIEQVVGERFLSICCAQCSTTIEISPHDLVTTLLGVLRGIGAAHIADQVRRVTEPLSEEF